MYRIVAHSFPNNEVRVTFSSAPGGKDPFSIEEAEEGIGVLRGSDDSPDDFPTENNPPPLSLVPYSQSERSSAGFGSLPEKPTTFGLNAKRSLLRQGGALEQIAPPEECLFLTGTLPGSTDDAFRSLAEWSGYIVHRLKSWIGNYATQKLDFYVWEYQKRGALHLHYCVHVPSDSHRRNILNTFREWWIQILHRVGEKSRCDLFRKNSRFTWLSDLSKVRAVAEICRKSPARYLAKYLSKSASPIRGSSRFFTPSRWWGTSRPLKAAADRLTEVVEIVEAGCNAVRRTWEEVSHFCDSSESVTYSYRHKVGIGETYVCYPKTIEEKECLMQNLSALSVNQKMYSTSQERLPSVELKILKTAQVQLLTRLSQTSLSITPGLRSALEGHLNTILLITPTTSVEPLSVLLAWAANISDLAYICRFTPVWDSQSRRAFGTWLDTLERSIKDVAENGWR